MNNYEFYHFLLENPWGYVSCLFVSAVVHYIVYRRIIFTIFDPLFLFVVFEIWASAAVYFLFMVDEISSYDFISFLCCQCAFWIGLRAFPSIKAKLLTRRPIEKTNGFEYQKKTAIIFYLSTIILLSCQGIVYYMKGIPIFLDSRLEIFAQGKGEGIFGRIIDVMSICSLFTFFSIIRFDFLRKSELPKYLLLAVVFVTFLLSGSKSAFLTVVYSFWAFLVFSALKGQPIHRLLLLLRKYTKLIIAASFGLVILVIFVQTKGQENGWFMLALRFVHSGDIYWYAYPNDVYKIIDSSHPFQALFTDMLGMLRIYKWEDLPQAIGVILKDYHHPTKELDGPNARFPVFGLVYFGFAGGIFFSFIIGIIFSTVRNVVPLLMGKSAISGIVFSYLMIKLPSLATDPMLGLTAADNLLFVLPLILLPLLTFNTLVTKRTAAPNMPSRN
jgi:hypothetical protein